MKILKAFSIRWSNNLQCLIVEEPDSTRMRGFNICGYFNTITSAYQWLLDNNFIDFLPNTDKPTTK